MGTEVRIRDLLDRLALANVTLEANGENIHWVGPASAMTSALRGEVADLKQALLLAVRNGEAEWFPLAPVQERLFVLHCLDPNRSDLNVSATARLRDDLDAAALQCALDILIANHDALRTGFALRHGRARQRLHRQVQAPLKIVHAEGEVSALRIAQEDSLRPFDLSTPPTLRALAVRYEPRAWLVQLTFHHLTCDQYGLRLAVNEVLARYPSATMGSPLPVQYERASYLRYALAASRKNDFGSDLAYWREQLAGIEPKGTTGGAGRAYVVEQAFPPSIVSNLSDLALEGRCTLTAAVLAIFALALHLQLSRAEVAIGIPFNTRTSDYDETVGMFVNSLVIRLREAAEASFMDWMDLTSRALRGAIQHADVPYHDVVRTVLPGQGKGELYDAWLALRDEYQLPSTATLGLERSELDDVNANHGLKLEIDRNTSGGMSATLIGSTSQWKPTDMDSVAATFSAILSTVCDHPGVALPTLKSMILDRAGIIREERQQATASTARARLQEIRRRPAT